MADIMIREGAELNGERWGPCPPEPRNARGVVLWCGHEECREARRIADGVCDLCDRRLGYNAWLGTDEETGQRFHRECFG